MTLAAGGLGIGSMRLGRLGRNNFDQPIRESLVSQLASPEFLPGPAGTVQATLRPQRIDRGWLHSDSIPQIIDQRIQIDFLDALARLVRPVATTALSLTCLDPIGRFVAGTL